MVMSISEDLKTLISDLNYLIKMIAFINDSLDMDINTDLYKNKITEDILFINNTLIRIEKNLNRISITENEFVPVLKKIKNVKDNTIMLLDNIIRFKYRHAGMFDLFIDDFKLISELYKISSDEIQKKLNRKQFLFQPDNQISTDELHFLFTTDESDHN